VNEIKIKSNISLDNYIRYNLFSLNKYHKLELQYKFLVIFGISCLILSYFSNYWYLLLFLGIFSISIRYIYPRSLVKKLKKLVKDSPTILSNGEITLNEYEIIEVTDISTTHIKWKDIYSVDDDGDMLYIYFTKIQAFVIEKNLLSDQELDQLRKWIIEKGN